MENQEFVYRDGNGNRYKFTREYLEYIPVQPEESSSGIYSGGEPFVHSTRSNEFDVWSTMMQRIAHDTTTHTDDTSKGVAWIFIRNGEDVISFGLKPGSVYIDEIEIFLEVYKPDK